MISKYPFVLSGGVSPTEISSLVSHQPVRKIISIPKRHCACSDAILLHHQAEDFKLKMEEMYRQRDLLLSKIKETLLASREILSGVHRSNMKRMGEWGFSIDDSPKASMSKKSV
jgi:hypothetical protein